MMDDAELSTRFNALLFLMTQMSPKVQDGIDIESFRYTADSDCSDTTQVLLTSVKALLDDLDDLGVDLDIDPSDFVQSPHQLNQLVGLAQVLMPTTLLQLMRTSETLRSVISDILDGSLGQEGEPIIKTYLSELAGLDNHTALYPELTDIVDMLYPHIKQTCTFTDYLKNLLNQYNETHPTTMIDPERHAQYRDVLKDIVSRMAQAVQEFVHQPYYETLMHMQTMCIYDLLSPDNFVSYSYLFLESEQTLPPSLLRGYARSWYHYSVSHPWCYPYYQVRKLTPNPESAVMSLCFAYALAGDRQEFVQSTQPYLQTPLENKARDQLQTLFAKGQR